MPPNQISPSLEVFPTLSLQGSQHSVCQGQWRFPTCQALILPRAWPAKPPSPIPELSHLFLQRTFLSFFPLIVPNQHACLGSQCRKQKAMGISQVERDLIQGIRYFQNHWKEEGVKKRKVFQLSCHWTDTTITLTQRFWSVCSLPSRPPTSIKSCWPTVDHGVQSSCGQHMWEEPTGPLELPQRGSFLLPSAFQISQGCYQMDRTLVWRSL